MKYTDQYIRANGITHHFLEWEDENKPPLVMVHATGLSSHTWLPIAGKLAADYHVLALDQRGHGDTEPSDCGYSFELVGQDLAAVIDTLGLEQVSMVGHSSGGLAAMMAASLIPGRIRQTCLVETRVGERPANSPPGELLQRAQRTRQKRLIWDSRQAMSEAYRQRSAFRDWDEGAFRAFIEGGPRLLPDGRAELKCPPEVEAIFYEKRETLQVSPYLHKLTGRYLLLLGSYPEAQTLQDTGVRRFLESVKGAKVKPLGVGSHFLPMEHPDLVSSEIQSFFQDGQ
ncbi:MAG: alpha/beta hydrolase [Chloroflexota bacterium]|nr:alpha/beta hydrolase [Chloroflexota bacterium]